MLRIAFLMVVMVAAQVNAQQTQVLYDGIDYPAHGSKYSDPSDEPSYLGKPLSFWLNSLRNNDTQMATAFDAIQSFGPAAAAAVPDLTRIVSKPFEPIRIGVDTGGAIQMKLFEMQLHSAAVDCLTAIGSSAGPSATALTEWALKPKVLLDNIRNRQDQEAFIDLVGIDVLERMRVAGAIAHFAPEASLVIAKLLKSSDEDARKLGVAILSEHSLPIATGLLKSKSCTDQRLGLKIMSDMWPVVARTNLYNLQDLITCASSASN